MILINRKKYKKNEKPLFKEKKKSNSDSWFLTELGEK